MMNAVIATLGTASWTELNFYRFHARGSRPTKTATSAPKFGNDFIRRLPQDCGGQNR